MSHPYRPPLPRTRCRAVLPVLALALVVLLGGAGCKGEDDEFASEGSASNPFSLGDARFNAVSHEGSVDTTAPSYYSVLVDSADTNYTITLRGLSEDADLFVFYTASFTDPACVSINTGSADETCTSLNPSIDQLYIQVKLAGEKGTKYVLTVTPGA